MNPVSDGHLLGSIYFLELKLFPSFSQNLNVANLLYLWYLPVETGIFFVFQLLQ